RTRKTNGGSDFITIKYDANGGVVWQQRYKARNDTWTAEANKLAVTSDGGVLVVGTIFDGASTNFMTGNPAPLASSNGRRSTMASMGTIRVWAYSWRS